MSAAGGIAGRAVSGTSGAANAGGSQSAGGFSAEGSFAGAASGGDSAVLAGSGGCGQAPCMGLACQIAICPDGASTTVTGKVYDPAGKVPLYNMMVYVPGGALDALPSGASCGGCTGESDTMISEALTDTNGAFTLQDVPTGVNIPVVIQSGNWRRQITLGQVVACQQNVYDDPNQFRLPKDQSEGELPKIAVTTGQGDALECFLHRVGVADSQITLYTGLGGASHSDDGSVFPPTAELLSDPDALRSFGLLLMSCEDSESQAKLTPSADKVALKAYVDAGGSAFLEHFQATYLRGDDGYEPTPFAPVTTGWSNSGATSSDYTIDTTFPKGAAFAHWLSNVGESSGGSLSLDQVQNAAVGVQASVTRWVYDGASVPFFGFANRMAAPASSQCGRVVHLGLHVSTGEDTAAAAFPSECGATALSAQEKALEFLLFDGPQCVIADHTRPTLPCPTPRPAG